MKAIAAARRPQDKLDILKYSPEEAAAEMVRATFGRANFYEMCEAHIDKLIAVAEAAAALADTIGGGHEPETTNVYTALALLEQE